MVDKDLEVKIDKLIDGQGKLTDRVSKLGVSMDRLINDHVKLEIKVDKVTEALNKKPDREEFPQLLDRVLEFTTLKIEHEHIKKIIKEKFQVEV